MTHDRRSNKRVVTYRASVPGEGETYEVEYESVADALHFACRDLRTGRRTPLHILEDGEEVYDEEGIVRACAELHPPDGD
jgi:hypothetical protein